MEREHTMILERMEMEQIKMEHMNQEVVLTRVVLMRAAELTVPMMMMEVVMTMIMMMMKVVMTMIMMTIMMMMIMMIEGIVVNMMTNEGATAILIILSTIILVVDLSVVGNSLTMKKDLTMMMIMTKAMSIRMNTMTMALMMKVLNQNGMRKNDASYEK